MYTMEVLINETASTNYGASRRNTPIATFLTPYDTVTVKLKSDITCQYTDSSDN